MAEAKIVVVKVRLVPAQLASTNLIHTDLAPCTQSEHAHQFPDFRVCKNKDKYWVVTRTRFHRLAYSCDLEAAVRQAAQYQQDLADSGLPFDEVIMRLCCCSDLGRSLLAWLTYLRCQWEKKQLPAEPVSRVSASLCSDHSSPAVQ